MINKKLAGLLLVPLMGATMGMSQAATPSASQTLSATLGSLINITANGGVISTSMNVDTGNLAAPLTPAFSVQTNGAQSLYLQAATASSTVANEVAFFEQGSQVYVILSNIASGQLPTTAAVANCKVASPDATLNPNAIAYNVTGVVLTGASTSTPVFDAVKNQYDVNVNAGETEAVTTIATTALPTTYSYLDTAGTYQAVVTLTNTTL